MRAVGGLLPRALRSGAGREQVLASLVLDSVQAALIEVIAPDVARRTKPVSFRGETVTVQAESSVIASEVRMLSVRILQVAQRSVKKKGFRITLSDLRVRVG